MDIIVDEILSRGFSFIYVFPDMIWPFLESFSVNSNDCKSKC